MTYCITNERKRFLCGCQQNAAFSIAPLAMTSHLATSVDFTLPFYRSRVVVAAMRRHRETGWSSAGLGRPLTTSVWVASTAVIVTVGLLIGVAHCYSHVLDDDQQMPVNDNTSSASATSTARRRRLKTTFRPREFKYSWWPSNVSVITAVVVRIIFLPRCMECRRGLAKRILSVRPSVRLSLCLSVKRVHCNKTKEKSVQIFIPYERSFSLVF